jgi:hypothetical protein
MSPTAAVVVITWVALVIVYLGLAAVLREVRQLRAELAAVRAGAPRAKLLDLTLPTLAAAPGEKAVVLVADSGCPACVGAAGELVRLAPELPVRPTLLTYEPPETWEDVTGRLTVVQDRAASSQFSHLTPPLLALVDARGQVTELALLVDPQSVARTLWSWGFELAAERI